MTRVDLSVEESAWIVASLEIVAENMRRGGAEFTERRSRTIELANRIDALAHRGDL